MPFSHDTSPAKRKHWQPGVVGDVDAVGRVTVLDGKSTTIFPF